MKFKTLAYCFLTLLTQGVMNETHSAMKLQETERQSLRYHLENLYNEVDLLIKNQKADERDFNKLERHFAELKVFERIPFEANPEGLKQELKASAAEHSLELIRVSIIQKPHQLHPMPQERSTHSSLTWLKPEHFVKKIHFQAELRGEMKQILEWLKHIKLEQMRLIDWEPAKVEASLKQISAHRWILKAHAFQFLRVNYPHLVPKKPREFLPAWARTDLKAFAKQEPLLWSLIIKTEAKLSTASKLYQRKGLFKLNEARLNFFLSKTLELHSLENT